MPKIKTPYKRPVKAILQVEGFKPFKNGSFYVRTKEVSL